jgi:hypothetical protein
MFLSHRLALGLSVAIIVALSAASSQCQGIVNGDFESGSFAPGWQPTEVASGTVQWYYEVRVNEHHSFPHGDYWAFLNCDALGQESGEMSEVYTYVVSSPFSVSAGDTVLFEYHATTTTWGPSPVASAEVGAFITPVAGGPDIAFSPLPECDGDVYDYANWRTASLTLPASGDYTLSLYTHATATTLGARASMYVDNARLTSVPEPSTMLLATVGIVALLPCVRRHRP